MKRALKITCVFALLALAFMFNACKKDKLITDSSATISPSDDKVLFDTVFTSIGSSTRNIRIRNNNNQKIRISSINLKGGTASKFIINVDGAKGVTFSDIDIAAHDSIYIFIQVNIDPNNASSPLIVNDQIDFVVNGNTKVVELEAWGQDAYYHRPTNAIKFQDGSYFTYSRISNNQNADTVWKKDKPHVVYGYLVVDSAQKLTIQPGVQIYMNYKAGLWVFQYGQLQILGAKDNEVIIQGARREKEFADEPGQWDRIWINEGSDNNIIDYAIIKNGYIGIQTELFGDRLDKGQLTLSNTKIQNMSLWGIYSSYYRILGYNNVVSNCQEYCLNLLNGGAYEFLHCTFANYWEKDKPRDKTTVNINNYNDKQTLPINARFGNCIIDGKLDNELTLDMKSIGTSTAYACGFSNCWIKTSLDLSATGSYTNIVKGDKSTILDYKDVKTYNFEPAASETRIRNFINQLATDDAKLVPKDIKGVTRNVVNVTAGAYEVQ